MENFNKEFKTEYDQRKIFNNKDVIYVKIADLKFAKAPKKLKTLLGSCVGICLYNSDTKTGALAHIMLPKKERFGKNPFKFADTAILYMINEFKRLGISNDSLIAKIFGGAMMYSSATQFLPDVGSENVKSVRKLLKRYKIKIVAEDVGGNVGRTILFDLNDGIVYCKDFKGRLKSY